MKALRFMALPVFVLSFAAAQCYAQDCRIQWLYPEQPPMYITKGEDAGKGIAQQSQIFFANRLSDCRHEFVRANLERTLNTIRHSEDACSAALIPTPERREYIEFSLPVRVTLSNALIVLESQKKRFKPYINEKGHISLEKLIKNGFRIGVAKGRAYRGVVDEILLRHKNDPRIIEHYTSEDMVGKLAQMMALGRLDCIIAYPTEVKYSVKSIKNMPKTVSIHIEGMEEYGLSHVGCSKTEKGKEIIRRLNSLIQKYRASPEFMGYMEHWLDPDARKRFRKYTAAEFGR